MPNDKDVPADDDRYDGWDWRTIKLAITGSVNTDVQTAQNSLGGTSNPSSLVTAGGHFDAAYTALNSTWENMKTETDTLVGFDDPLWKGEAATAFKGLAMKTMASVKAHADPLAGPPSYKTTLNDAAGYLTWAINKVNEQDAEMARRVIDRWTQENTYQIGGSKVTDLSGSKPWHDQNGTTIVHISHYPDMDNELSVQMRGTINTLAQNYRKSRNGMPAPAAPLPAGPGPGPGAPDDEQYKKDFEDYQDKINKDLDEFQDAQKKAAEEAAKLQDQPQLGAPEQLTADQRAAEEAAAAQRERLGQDQRAAEEAARRAAEEAKRNLGNGLIPNPVVPGPLVPGGSRPGTGNRGGLRVPNARLPTVPGIKAPKLSNAQLLNNLKKLGVSPPNLNRLTAGGPPPGATSPGGPKPGAAAFGAKGAGGRGNGMGYPPPMGGGMGGAGGAGGEQSRDRTTWLTEDEEIWGAESEASAGVLGR